MSSLPNVRHVKHTAFSGEGSDAVAERRKSVLLSAPEPASEPGQDRTSQTIQDIDDLLRSSGYGGDGDSGGAGEGAFRKGDNRRRTVAFGSQYATGSGSGAEVVQDEVWGTSSTYSVVETAADVDLQSVQLQWGMSSESSVRDATVSGGPQEAVGADQATAGQRRGRPRSLPETRSDAIGDRTQRAPPAQPLPVTRQGSTEAEAMLGDVPKPTPSGSAAASKRVPSLVDEELECVTANVNELVG
jgi:hypothetical protein